MEAIYERPLDYDLEHEGDDEDVRFYSDLVKRLRPRRVLELASGSGRVTIPLARLASEMEFDIVGLEIADAMLAEAERKRCDLATSAQQRVTFVRGDLRDWRSAVPFDLIVTPCSSLSHLLTLDDQLSAWRTAHANLAPGGRFIADVTMANLPVYAESMQTPPRTTLEIDIDTNDPSAALDCFVTRRRAICRTSSVRRSGSSTTNSRTATAWIGTSATSNATCITRASSSCCSAARASRSRRRMVITRGVRSGPRAGRS